MIVLSYGAHATRYPAILLMILSTLISFVQGQSAPEQIGQRLVPPADEEYREMAMNADGTIIAFGGQNGDVDIGAQVWKYDPSTTNWTLMGNELNSSVLIGSGYDYDDFGCGLALSDNGKILAVGDWGSGSDGAIFTFHFNDGTQLWELKGTATFTRDHSDNGANIALSGDGTRLASMTKWGDDVGSGLPSGTIGGVWETNASQLDLVMMNGMPVGVDFPIVGMRSQDWDQDYDCLSSHDVTLSRDGTKMLMSQFDSCHSTTDEANGAVTLEEWDGTTWSRTFNFTGFATQGIQSQFGFSTAMSDDGSVVVISARFEPRDYNASTYVFDSVTAPIDGCVYTFHKDTSTGDYNQVSKIFSPQTFTGPCRKFGQQARLSADGQRLVVSGMGGNNPFNDGYSASVGCVAYYTWDTTSQDWSLFWNHSYADASSEQFGYDVRMSADGNIIGVTSIKYQGSSSNKGSLDVWNMKFPSPSPSPSSSPEEASGDDDAGDSFTAAMAVGGTLIVGAGAFAAYHFGGFAAKAGVKAGVTGGSEVGGAATAAL